MVKPESLQSDLSSHLANKWVEHACLAGLLLLAFIFRVFHLGKRSLSSDEIGQVLWAQENFWRSLASELFPPLYPLLAKPFLWIGKETGPRMLSVLAGVLFCFLIWKIAKQAFGPAVAILTLLFASVSPQLIALSRVALPHMLFVAFAALSILLFEKMRYSPTLQNSAWFALAVAGAFYSFYFAAFLWLFFITVSIFVFPYDRKKAKQMLLACGAGLALFLPMILLFLLNTQRIEAIDPVYDWAAGPGQLLRRSISLLIGFSPTVGIQIFIRVIPIRLIGVLVLFALAYFLLVYGFFGLLKRNRGNPAVGFFIGYFFFCSFCAILFHWIFRFPIQDHYFAFLTIPVLPLAAGACLWPRTKVVSGIIIAMLVFSSMAALKSHILAFHEDMREAIRWIDQRAKDGAMILAIDFELADAYQVYGKKNLDAVGLPQGLPGHHKIHRGQTSTVHEKDRKAFLSLVKSRKQVFLLTSNPKHGQEDRGLGFVNQWMNEMGYELKGLESFDGGAVSKFNLNN